MTKFEQQVAIHECSREMDDILTRLYCKELLNEERTLEEKKETVNRLKQTREIINRIEDSNAKNHYKEGKIDGTLNGILIGELLMACGYGLGILISKLISRGA